MAEEREKSSLDRLNKVSDYISEIVLDEDLRLNMILTPESLQTYIKQNKHEEYTLSEIYFVLNCFDEEGLTTKVGISNNNDKKQGGKQ